MLANTDQRLLTPLSILLGAVTYIALRFTGALGFLLAFAVFAAFLASAYREANYVLRLLRFRNPFKFQLLIFTMTIAILFAVFNLPRASSNSATAQPTPNKKINKRSPEKHKPHALPFPQYPTTPGQEPAAESSYPDC